MLYTTPNKNVSSILGTSPDEMDTPGRGSDRILLISVIVLMVFGVLAIYSAIAYFAETNQTTAGSLITGHVFKLGIAFLAMLIASKIDYHLIAKFSRLGIVIGWVLLLAVTVFGTESFGAKRSLSIGGLSFQPAAFASLALLIHISVLLDEKQEYIKDFKRTFLPIMFWVVATCGLIGLQDFSSAAVLLGLSLLVMFVGGISMSQLGTLMLIGIMGAGILIWQSPERQSRISNYLEQINNINSSELNIEEGYQAQQAHIAIAQGEIFGVGIGQSSQRDFLPAPYNDFIFAIIAEEYGLVGSMLVIVLFTVILFRGIGKIAKSAPDPLGMLMAVGCTLSIVFYGFINAGVASGLLPVTGLPMPFVSYGGTNILFAGIMVGILMNISKYNNDKKAVFYA
ncbi:cell division protein FtsW [Fodinibius salinus]|uniref:Probable peptidoglycan glycosyltransferase FtsW n=1 Tax=Fodinibius salinus TaxID=860790 RepID=A0A5D3YGT3_9BACT|nr:putative peptidoglycan glycosyltransferase FtsW [Fodinibius salinus]TYP92213.1 cell division protein FtsW [Fodinibius salinus]